MAGSHGRRAALFARRPAGVLVPLTPDEHAILADAAARAGKTEAELMREVFLYNGTHPLHWDHADLQHQIEDLRVFERTYRTEVRRALTEDLAVIREMLKRLNSGLPE